MRSALLLVFLSACASVDLGQPASRVWQTTSMLSTGSCVPIAHRDGMTIFLTAGHNLGPAMSVNPSGGAGIAVERMEVNPKRDVALLWVRGTFPLVPMAKRNPALSQRVLCVGYAFGREMIVSEGRASRPGVCTAPAIFGCSGGLVMNEDGELVGVIEGMSVLQAAGLPFELSLPVPVITYYVPLAEVRAWVASMV